MRAELLHKHSNRQNVHKSKDTATQGRRAEGGPGLSPGDLPQEARCPGSWRCAASGHVTGLGAGIPVTTGPCGTGFPEGQGQRSREGTRPQSDHVKAHGALSTDQAQARRTTSAQPLPSHLHQGKRSKHRDLESSRSSIYFLSEFRSFPFN